MKFQIVAGNFPKETKYIPESMILKYLDKAKSKPFAPVYKTVSLRGKVVKVEIVTEENKKKILGSAGWGIVGFAVGSLIAAPVAIAAGLAGVLKGGSKREICFACYLKDGKKFMAVADSNIYMQISSLAF
jgi:O-phosphoseryl-tRNA(Cys) synthetase